MATNLLLGVKERSDRLMNYFLASYFLAGLLFATFYGTWLIAIGIGGLSLSAYYSTKKMLPDSDLYQYVLSAVLGIFMAQFIYQMHGLFEMHFFAFIGSALLITYQNWKLQLPMVIIVFIHHGAFGYLQNAGISEVYFTRLSHFNFQTFLIHITLAAVIFFVCGLWSYQLKKYTDLQLSQALHLAELEKNTQLTIERQHSLEERNGILESISDAFFSVDRNFYVTYWNCTAEMIMQTPKEDIIGKCLWDLFPEGKKLNSYRKYNKAIQYGIAQHFEDFYPPMQSWYEVSAYPSEAGLSVYFKDITVRKKNEMELNKLNDSLKKQTRELSISNAQLEQFAYAASHDLQEPLRMVSSFLGQIERKYGHLLDERGHKYVHFAVDGATRMRQIILDLLEFSKVGRTEYDLEKIDLGKLVNEVTVLCRKSVDEKQAVLSFENLPCILSYRTPLRLVFQNLICNALKYQPSKQIPVINIYCKETQSGWEIAIRDNGIGIDPAYFEEIFTLFRRLHTRQEYAGSGMGLAVTKKIIENLGGKIWVEAAGRVGSTFIFTVPRNPARKLTA